MKLSSSLLVILSAVALANCEVFYEEKFLDGKLTAFKQQKRLDGCKPAITLKNLKFSRSS